MNCKNCGQELIPNMNFCANCGCDVASMQEQEQEQEEELTNCTDCGQELIPNMKFCANCGKDIASMQEQEQELTNCKSCGQELIPNMKFCANCGKDIACTHEDNKMQNCTNSVQNITIPKDINSATNITDTATNSSIDMSSVPNIDSKIKKVKTSTVIQYAIALVVLMFVVNYLNFSGQEDLVKNSKPFNEYGMTYGEAFDNFFDETDWESFKSTDDKYIIEFNGYSTMSASGTDLTQKEMDEMMKEMTGLTIQFELNEDKTRYEFVYCEFASEKLTTEAEILENLRVIFYRASFEGDFFKDAMQQIWD